MDPVSSAHIGVTGQTPGIPLHGRLPMFTAPARKLANTLVNAMIFADPKAVDHRSHLGCVRIQVNTNQLVATATDQYILGQGRTAGASPGDIWGALLPLDGLKAAASALKRSKADAWVDFDGTAVIFTIDGERFEVPAADGFDRFSVVDSLFPEFIDHGNSRGYSVFDPAALAKLGKLRDYDAANTVVERFHPHSLQLGLNPDPSRPAVAAFGPDFRLMVAALRANGLPPELAEAGRTGWLS